MNNELTINLCFDSLILGRHPHYKRTMHGDNQLVYVLQVQVVCQTGDHVWGRISIMCI